MLVRTIPKWTKVARSLYATLTQSLKQAAQRTQFQVRQLWRHPQQETSVHPLAAGSETLSWREIWAHSLGSTIVYPLGCSNSLVQIHSGYELFQNSSGIIFLRGNLRGSCVCCITSLYNLDTDPLLDMPFANIISLSVGWRLVLLIVSFTVQKVFISMRSQ